MQKMNLARNLCRTAFLRPIYMRFDETKTRFHTLNAEMRNHIPRVQNPTFPQKEAEHVNQLVQWYGVSIEKLGHDFLHFKDHVEPNLHKINMLRNYLAPSVAAAFAAALFGVIQYKGRLQEEFEAPEKTRQSAQTPN